jgi:hypothetical protein
MQSGQHFKEEKAMEAIEVAAKFHPGRIRITRGAMAALTPDEAMDGLVRHLEGDWGEVDESDRKENEAALEHGFRLLSSYKSNDGTTYWIITEHDRSYTTILLPNEY